MYGIFHLRFFCFRIKEDHSLECLQLLNNEKKLYVQERDKVKEEVRFSQSAITCLVMLEAYYTNGSLLK